MKGTVFYGMHMEPGVAEYREPGKQPYRILAKSDAIKRMDPTFAGRPVYVNHVDGVPEDKQELRGEADGYVSESFYNPPDGRHWVKFIAITDKALLAIAQKFRLSNAYLMKRVAGGGSWHAVDYDKEVLDGEYEHLAIVNNPRYEGSVILTPQEFKTYNENKEKELLNLKNSVETKEGEQTMLKFFKKTKVENSLDLEGTLVVLPKSKKEVEVSVLVNQADEAEVAKKENEGKPVYANGDHMVKVGEGEMSVNELVEKYSQAMTPADDQDQDPELNAEDEESDEDKKKKENEAEEAKKAADEKKQNAIKAAAKLKNAKDTSVKTKEVILETMIDQCARGKSKYGSSK